MTHSHNHFQPNQSIYYCRGFYSTPLIIGDVAVSFLIFFLLFCLIKDSRKSNTVSSRRKFPLTLPLANTRNGYARNYHSIPVVAVSYLVPHHSTHSKAGRCLQLHFLLMLLVGWHLFRTLHEWNMKHSRLLLSDNVLWKNVHCLSIGSSLVALSHGLSFICVSLALNKALILFLPTKTLHKDRLFSYALDCELIVWCRIVRFGATSALVQG